MDSDHPDYPELCASTTLQTCGDFREETGAMETLILHRGHLCLFSSKGHPEIAGAGVEYDWGVSKKTFRRENNHIPKYCERDVRSSLGKIDLSIAFNTSRKARSYMSAYMNDSYQSQLLIEKFVKLHKCHRNILDQECKFLDQLKLEIEKHAIIIKEEKLSIKLEKETSMKVDLDSAVNEEKTMTNTKPVDAIN